MSFHTQSFHQSKKKWITHLSGKRYVFEFVDNKTLTVFNKANRYITMELLKKYPNINIIEYSDYYHRRKDFE